MDGFDLWHLSDIRLLDFKAAPWGRSRSSNWFYFSGFITFITLSLLKWFGVRSLSSILLLHCYLYRSKNNTLHWTKIIWMIPANLCWKVLMRQVRLNPFYLHWAKMPYFGAAGVPSSKKHQKPSFPCGTAVITTTPWACLLHRAERSKAKQSVPPAPVQCTPLKVVIGQRWHEVKL